MSITPRQKLRDECEEMVREMLYRFPELMSDEDDAPIDGADFVDQFIGLLWKATEVRRMYRISDWGK
jgi:hypothetical protein